MSEATLTDFGGLAEALANGRRLLDRDPQSAAAQAKEILGVNPTIAEAYLLLGDALARMGREGEAADALLTASVMNDPLLRDASFALAENRVEAAEPLLRQHLRAKPNEAGALRMLAGIAAGSGFPADAELLLRRALKIVPRSQVMQAELAQLLAQRQAERMAAPPAGDAEFAEALRLNEEAVRSSPDEPRGWLSYGHVLRIAGRQEDSIGAYREAVRLAPGLGEAWWALADLKTYRFSEAEIQAMREALEQQDPSDADRISLHFSLGKALEDMRRYEEAFEQYTAANRIKRSILVFSPAAVERHVRECEATFTRTFFEERRGQGSEAPDPVFIIGLPRSGSTLVEQILSCHSMVEATEELQDVLRLARMIAGGKDAGMEESPYVENVAGLNPARLRMLGDAYIASTDRQRKSRRPFFIDKMPDNWLHLGLIATILPNARIIDARRHPIACCLSNFRQQFANGRGYSYDLVETGQYYRSYVRSLGYFDRVLPNRIHRVFHEKLVDDPKAEVERLLAYLGLPFEEACLRFHESDRAVKTSSSEQVRRPVSRDGVEQWKHFEPWLGPLKQALGSVLLSYPEVPSDWS